MSPVTGVLWGLCSTAVTPNDPCLQWQAVGEVTYRVTVAIGGSDDPPGTEFDQWFRRALADPRV